MIKNAVELEMQSLLVDELAMQELETMEAPGWATSIGVSVGITIVSVAWSIT